MHPAAARRAIVGAACALAAAGALALGARAWLADVLTAPGAPEPQRPLSGHRQTAPAVPRAPVRVVLLDGLTRADARRPVLDAFCARGMDLAVDVGFPTKSLPVQTVLWSGLTAQQSGVAMRNELARPLASTLPARVPGARAVTEAWPRIAADAGFARVDVVPAANGFADAAVEAVAGDAPLLLVHVLGIDETGHRSGRGAAYRAQIDAADALLGRLLARAPDASWLVLSDHGHVAGGGHGDVERDVRIVRGCVLPRPPGAPPSGDVHLVDVSRHLHDTLGVALPPRAVGRPLAVAAMFPDPDATLPRASTLSLVVAFVVAAAGLAAAARWGRPRAAAFAPLLALGIYAVACGTPSLSQREPNIALALGALVAAAVVAVPGRLHPARVIALVAPAVSATIAAAILTRLPLALVGGPPARLPLATAWTQILVAAVTPMLLVGVALAGAHLSGRRTSGNRTPTSGGSDQAVRRPDSG